MRSFGAYPFILGCSTRAAEHVFAVLHPNPLLYLGSIPGTIHTTGADGKRPSSIRTIL
ncbi:MAG TPA: hypothetical protein VMO17_22945 [Terriglobia bacterium]|nr:hypothetical protein [Terriglobia bacterium]